MRAFQYILAVFIFSFTLAAAEPQPPGTVVDFSPSKTKAFVGSPSLAILPNGEFVMSHDFFGPGSTNDTTVVFGSTPQALTAALDRHAHGGGITGADYARAFTGLPTNGQLQTFGSLTEVLSRPSAAKAQQVPWVAALRGYAASISESAAA